MGVCVCGTGKGTNASVDGKLFSLYPRFASYCDYRISS